MQEIDPKFLGDHSGKGKGGKGNKAKKDQNGTIVELADFVPGPLDVDEEVWSMRADMGFLPGDDDDDIAATLGEEASYFAIQYGLEVAEAFDTVSDHVDGLEGADDAIMSVIRSCYDLLSDSARMNIATNGLR
jgi:hypothetical protein